MTEVVDLTFTDSDDEPQPRPSQQAPSAAATVAGGAGRMRTPLRQLLARHRGDLAEDTAPPPRPAPSPEAINLLESPEPTKQHAHRETNPLKRRQDEKKKEKEKQQAAAAAAPLDPSGAGPSRPPRTFAYDPADYENEFAEESYEPDYPSPKKTPPGRKPKRTREEIARDKELRKQQK
jgi:hypothetical protein